jgi:hypothetical protein
MSEDFSTGNIIKDYADVASTRAVQDDAADFENNPSPLYLRARHKDSVVGIESPWSHPTEAHIQRVYANYVIGVEMYVSNNSFVRHIDEDGNPVSVPPSYFDNHSIYANILPTTWDAGAYDESIRAQDMVRLPFVYCKADTITVDGQLRHRFWVSPVQKDGFYLHPAFAQCNNSLLVSAALFSLDSSTGSNVYVSRVGVGAAASSVATMNAVSNAMNSVGQKAQPYNFYARALVQLLMMIEKSTIDFSSWGSGGTNAATSCVYRGMYSLFNVGALVGVQGFGYATGANQYLINVGDPFSLSNLSPLGAVGSGVSGGATQVVDSIKTGFDAFLGCDSEVFFIPTSSVLTNGDPTFNKYRNSMPSSYANTNLAMQENGALGPSIGRKTYNAADSTGTCGRFIVLE